MFGSVNVNEQSLINNYQLQYRANKTMLDIQNAMQKAKKNGRQKVEFELGMLELYLKRVLKGIK